MQYRDIYRGYEIDFNPDHDGYWVMADGVKIHEEPSFDAAANWIDKKKKADRNNS